MSMPRIFILISLVIFITTVLVASSLTELFTPINSKDSQWLSKFTFLKNIGGGYWSDTALCENNETNKLVIIKRVIPKWEVSEKHRPNIDIECKLQKRFINHPYIATLKDCLRIRDPEFPRNNRTYMELDYYPGGDLNGKTFSVSKARLYFAQMLIALEALHDANIIHRDIKTPNVFLENPNRVRLGDFGLAIDNIQTIQGTFKEGAGRFIAELPYAAPEIIRRLALIIDKKGNHQLPLYGKAVDYYSMGYFLYAILVGEENSKDMKYYIETIKFNRPYPHPTIPLSKLNTIPDRDAKDIISKLVRIDVKERLGSKRGIIELKEHPFLKSIDWKNL